MTIRDLRRKLNMSQRKFADYFNIPVVNVQHWEQGVSSPPDYVPYLINRVICLETELREGFSNGKSNDK